jgi:hypothetical protein
VASSGLPHTFGGILVGQRIRRRLLSRGTVEWGLGIRTARELCDRRASDPRRLSTIFGCLVA